MKIGDKVRIIATEEQMKLIFIDDKALSEFFHNYTKLIYTIYNINMSDISVFNGMRCLYTIKVGEGEFSYYFPEKYLEIANRKEKLERILNENN